MKCNTISLFFGAQLPEEHPSFSQGCLHCQFSQYCHWLPLFKLQDSLKLQYCSISIVTQHWSNLWLPITYFLAIPFSKISGISRAHASMISALVDKLCSASRKIYPSQGHTLLYNVCYYATGYYERALHMAVAYIYGLLFLSVSHTWAIGNKSSWSIPDYMRWAL